MLKKISPRSLARVALVAILTAVTTACPSLPRSFGADQKSARTNSDDLFGALTTRFTNVYRTPEFAVKRGKIKKHALTPSALFADSAAWTIRASDSIRSLFVEGSFAANRYTITTRAVASPIDAPADSRHFTRLRRLSPSEFEWFTSSDIAIGRIPAKDLSRATRGLLASGEKRTPDAIRADLATMFPRSSTMLGRLFTLDSVAAETDRDGATSRVFVFQARAERSSKSMPAFAAYLDKYLRPARLRIQVHGQGTRWLDLSAKESRLTIRLRSKGGGLLPLTGGTATLPDSVKVSIDATTKISLFTVGVQQLVADAHWIDGEHEQGWAFRFPREPEWKLPLAVGHLIRTSLRRPFAGGGSTFRATAVDAPGSQTLIARRTTLVVQESALLRFLNRLGGTAMGDFLGAAEIEQNRYMAEVFGAIRADMRAALP